MFFIAILRLLPNSLHGNAARGGASTVRRKLLGESSYLCFRCDYWFWGELHVGGLQDGVLLQDVLLGLVVAKRLEER